MPVKWLVCLQISYFYAILSKILALCSIYEFIVFYSIKYESYQIVEDKNKGAGHHGKRYYRRNN